MEERRRSRQATQVPEGEEMKEAPILLDTIILLPKIIIVLSLIYLPLHWQSLARRQGGEEDREGLVLPLPAHSSAIRRRQDRWSSQGACWEELEERCRSRKRSQGSR